MFFKRKRYLKNNLKTKKYLESKKTVYVIELWARWTVVEYPLERIRKGIPYVWSYSDMNGLRDGYVLRPITNYAWTLNEQEAINKVESLNKLSGF